MKRPFKKNVNIHGDISVSSNLDQQTEALKNLLFYTDDLKERKIFFNEKNCNLLYLESTADQLSIQEKVIKPLQEHKTGELERIVQLTQIKQAENPSEAAQGLIIGQCVLLMEGESTFYLMKVPSSENRTLSEPNNEQVIRGAHQGFNENLIISVHLIRERIKSPSLKVSYLKVGETSRTKVAIAYMHDLANPDLVQKVMERIQQIKADSIQTPGFLEEFIEESTFSPFPQILNSERPDRVAANLMEGRIALIMDGSPTVLILPVSFFAFFQSPEDYNSRSYISSFFRIIRIVSFLIAIALPAFYISIISFNYEVIPVEIIFSVKNSLEFVPFPPLIEALFMTLTLELLREAAVRLPNPIAQTIGVVGGLVIGTAVVQASLVSNTMIIVVAITAISSFVIPSHEMSTSVRILGFPMMILASALGYFGIVIGFMLILMHLCKLKSFGTPYFFPLAPFQAQGLKDTLLRLPIWMMNKRPADTKPQYSWKETYSREWKKDGKK